MSLEPKYKNYKDKYKLKSKLKKDLISDAISHITFPGTSCAGHSSISRHQVGLLTLQKAAYMSLNP